MKCKDEIREATTEADTFKGIILIGAPLFGLVTGLLVLSREGGEGGLLGGTVLMVVVALLVPPIISRAELPDIFDVKMSEVVAVTGTMILVGFVVAIAMKWLWNTYQDRQHSKT